MPSNFAVVHICLMRLSVTELAQAKYLTIRLRIPKEITRCRRVSKITRICSFYVVVLQGMATKCTMTYNARVQPLFLSLNLLFGNVQAAVAVEVLQTIAKKFTTEDLKRTCSAHETLCLLI